MGKPKVTWEADDGQEFPTERDMLLHEMGHIDSKEIDIFVNEFTTNKKLRTQYSRVLLAWMRYQRENSDLPLVTVPILEEDVADIFSRIEQGELFGPPDGYRLDDDYDDVDRSFEQATLI